ncbi:hypothetical protein SCP_0114400 [Sparassis crispa]|uniref:Uncharacterized protein n=1 Tax=Sparassis crispa TaxID=139825 RepID=A0A401G8Q6_9APHY|nr:hypothetical protein SCP_0114400 [Sparassis crispa]GBE78551.1 hypothetical protein SCP_0114400 [Sparassis crispa]
MPMNPPPSILLMPDLSGAESSEVGATTLYLTVVETYPDCPWKTRIVRSQQVARGRGCDQLRPAAKIWTICDLARAQSNVVAG